MRIESHLTDETIIEELGSRLAARRLTFNLTQAELGKRAGVDRKSVTRLENGDPVRLEILVRILRSLDLMDALDRLLPAPTLSPMQLLELRGRQRQRATGRRRQSPSVEAPPGDFRWGDEEKAD